MQSYYANHRKPFHAANVEMFKAIEAEFPLGFFFPNEAVAPWHVQASLTSVHGYSILLNFWPCAGKAQRDGERAVSGEDDIRKMIREAIDDASNPDGFSFDLIEEEA